MSVLIRLQYPICISDVLTVAYARSFPGPTSGTIFAVPHLPTDSNSRSFSAAGSAQPEQPPQKRRSLPYRASKERIGTPDDNIGEMPVSSSDGFNPDHDTLDILESINMANSSDRLSARPLPTPTQEKSKFSDDEDFITPPTSPSITETSTECLIDPELQNENQNARSGLFIQQSDLVQLPNIVSRKRSFPEANKRAFPRKASRGESGVQQPTAYSVNSLKPTAPPYDFDDPFHDRVDTASATRLAPVPGLSRSSTSFDSVATAATATTASSIAWSAPRSYTSGSTRTTPSTSFRSDSLTGSFTSNNSSFYNSDAIRPATISAPNTPRAKRRTGPLQRAATTSNVEAQAHDVDPMDIDRRGFDRRQGFISELLQTPKVEKKIHAANSEADCLPDHLRSLPLLGTFTFSVIWLPLLITRSSY